MDTWSDIYWKLIELEDVNHRDIFFSPTQITFENYTLWIFMCDSFLFWFTMVTYFWCRCIVKKVNYISWRLDAVHWNLQNAKVGSFTNIILSVLNVDKIAIMASTNYMSILILRLTLLLSVWHSTSANLNLYLSTAEVRRILGKLMQIYKTVACILSLFGFSFATLQLAGRDNESVSWLHYFPLHHILIVFCSPCPLYFFVHY